MLNIRCECRRMLILVGCLLVASGASASDECTTNGSLSPDALGAGYWRVATDGPFPTPCPAPEQDQECTGMEFAVTNLGAGDPDHVAILVSNVEVLEPPSRFHTPACQYDTRTGLGGNCHMLTVRMNRNSETGSFRLVVRGRNKAKIDSTIAFNKGKLNERCRLPSLGQDAADPFAQTTLSETIDFKGCVATIPIDPATGEGGTATLAGENCRFVANGSDVTTGELIVNGTNTGMIQLGQGFVSSGTGSCTTKIVNRKLYTWCTCEVGSGDPSPPCP